MRGWASCALCALFACGGSKGSTPDAARAADAPPTVDATPLPPDASLTDAMPSAVHTYYLNFEGQALTAGNDDPTTNTSSILINPFTAPPYLMNDAQRTTKIAAIVSEVQTILAPYDLAVTTTRPASGTYDMLVAGGLPQDAGLSAGVNSITPFDCMASQAHVVLLFDVGGVDQHFAAQQIVAMLGIAQAIPQSTQKLDCMCYASPSGCGQLTAACTIAGANTPVYSAQACNQSQTTMDENAEWLQVFGPHS